MKRTLLQTGTVVRHHLQQQQQQQQQLKAKNKLVRHLRGTYTRCLSSSPQTAEEESWKVLLFVNEPEYRPMQPFDYPPLDHSSRFLCQLLDDANMGKIHIDIPTTKRCNKMVAKLSDKTLGGIKVVGRAQRADEILWRMDRFFQRDNNNNHNNTFNETTTAPLRLPFELPHANRQTFTMVLKLYAAEKGLSGLEGPRRAEAIVRRMEERYRYGGELDMKPDVVCWNQVLSAWAGCTDVDKAFHAADLLGSSDIKDIADDSSYGHVLRACAHSNTNDRSRKLGAEVAVKVWRDFRSVVEKQKSAFGEADITTTSYMYTFLITAFGFIKDTKRRENLLVEAFESCCDAGQVNAHVLTELKRSCSNALFDKLLGKNNNNNKSFQGKHTLAILKQLPEDWTFKAQTKDSSGW